MARKVIFYRTISDKCPVDIFLNSLTSDIAQKVTWVLNLFEEFDILPKKYFKKITGIKDIWECRIDFKSNTYRIFCFFLKNNIVVLTHGITKKSQKLPKKEIIKAIDYMNDYKKRNKL